MNIIAAENRTGRTAQMIRVFGLSAFKTYFGLLAFDFLLMTSLSPDQVSSTAQTFTSTSPSGKAISRITSSVTSVGFLDAFFGQETQTAASARMSLRSCGNRTASSARRVTKKCTTSTASVTVLTNRTFAGSGASSLRYPAIAFFTATVDPGLIPSFAASGVPEYPAGLI
jgi:hypothetical protein